MLKFKIDLKGFDKEKKLTINKARTILMKSMFKMEEIAIREAPYDRGDIRKNISLFPEILSSNYILKSGSPHSAAMEYGTRPFYAPIKPLKDWARRKLGDENIGYAIRAKIAKVGVKAHPFMRPALYEVQYFWLDHFISQELK